MKKFYYSLFAVATMLLATTSCSQEEDFAQQSSNEVTTFSVALNGKSGARTIGDGTTATTLYYEVYRGDECIIDENVNINTTATVEMPLLKGETYDIIFWAQANGAIYKIDNLKNITIDYANANLLANQESYDAFYNALGGFEADGKSHTIELRRPFAQLNLGTDDWEKAKDGLVETEGDPITQTSVVVKGLADTFDTMNGVASGDAEATFKLSNIPEGTFKANNKDYKYLSLNYLLVPGTKKPQGDKEYKESDKESKTNVDITFALNRGTNELFKIEVPNAPVQRNWRTNVVGSLLTGSKFEVIIKPETDGDYNPIDLLKEVLTKGGELTLAADLTLTEPITIPEGVEAKINLNEKTLTVTSSDNIVKGNLVISDGNINVNAEGTPAARETVFDVEDGSTLELNDIEMEIANNNVAVVVNNRNANATINVSNSTITVGTGGYGIYVPNGAEYVEINIKESTIAGNYALMLSNVKESVVVLDEKSSVDRFIVDYGHATVKHAGKKPTVAGEESGYVTFVKMNATELEGIYQVEGSTNEYNVTSAEGVLNLYQLTSNIQTGEGRGVTINLTTDVDLKNKPFTPIDRMWVTFKGNGHTIKNLYITNTWKAGFFGYLGGGSINDLTIENANVTGAQAGIFAGAVEGTINNCFLKGTNTVTWAACHQYNDPASSLEAWNGIGAITGVLQPSTVNVEIVEGTIVTLNKEGFITDPGCKFVNNLTGYIGENKGKITNNGKVIVPYTASATDNLNDVLISGANNITLPQGDYTLPTMAGKDGITIIGDENGGTVIGGSTTSTGFGSNFGKNTTIKNVTFNGTTNGVRYSYAQGGTSTFENCTFAGDVTYGFHIDQSNGATFIFNNCTFSGFNAFAGDLVSVTFNNCTFKNNGNYGHTNIHSIAYFNECTWEDYTSVSPAKNTAKLYFNNNEESYHHEYIGSAENLFAFAKSVNEDKDSWNGQAVILVNDIDLNNQAWTPIGQTGATQFKGIFDGQNHTIKNLKVDSSAQTGGNYSSGLFGWAESGVTIKNIKVAGATVTGNHNVAVIVGYTYSGKIDNCHVSNANIVCNHANDDACGDKCGLIAGYAADESRISNCSAINCTVKAGRDAGQLIGCGYNVSISNCTATNVVVSATGECTGANVNNAIIGRVMK